VKVQEINILPSFHTHQNVCFFSRYPSYSHHPKTHSNHTFF